jgi:hypothetical protein
MNIGRYACLVSAFPFTIVLLRHQSLLIMLHLRCCCPVFFYSQIVVHFYRSATWRCQVVDRHFGELAPQHLETRVSE